MADSPGEIWKPAQTRPIAGRRLWFALRPDDHEAEHDAYTYDTRAEAQRRCDDLNAQGGEDV